MDGRVAVVISIVAALFAVAVCVVPACARMNMTVVSGGGGAAAASGYYDPNADVALGDWVTDCATATACWDDGIRYNTVPGADTDDVLCSFESTTVEVQFPEITGTISTLRVWAYGYDANAEAAGVTTCQISRDGGSSWEAARNINMPDSYANRAWVSVDFTGLSWDGTTDLRLRLTRALQGAFDNIYFWAVYLEANPS